MSDVAELAAAARAGDGEAYGALIERFQQMAYAVAYRHLGDHFLAQDLVQEALIEAFVCLPQLREPAAFPGWFRQIVLRQCTRALRQRGVSCASLDAARVGLLAESTPEELALRDEIRTCVRLAIAALPAHERMVVALFYGRRYSHREVSASLNIPITTVKKRLHSARQRLRVQLEAALRDEDTPRSSDGAEVLAETEVEVEVEALMVTLRRNWRIVQMSSLRQQGARLLTAA
jgi:RNA polymerase sigma factor (sigma-70 family)